MTHHVLRWHSTACPNLRNSNDTIEGHQIRVRDMCQELAGFMALPLIGSDLLDAARHHDEAEKVLGDMPGPAKRRFPDLAAAYEAKEAIVLAERGLGPWDLTDTEAAILDLCDKADALFWARKCGSSSPEWHDAEVKLRRAAWDLGTPALAWFEARLNPAEFGIVEQGAEA